MAELTFAGGLNEQDVSTVDINECIEGYNYELGFSNTSFAPRAQVDSAATTSNAAEIRGFIQLIKSDDSETTLVQSGTVLYSWDGASTFTSKATVSGSSLLRGTTWKLDDYAVVTDLAKLEPVSYWDGSTYAELPTTVSDTFYAKYAVVHLNRMWLFNMTTGSTAVPHLMVASALEDPQSYDTSARAGDSGFSTGEEAFYMTTPDLLPINGAEVWGKDLIISTENGRMWKLSGSDSLDFEWVPFYAGSASISNETMKNIGNDLVYMKRDGVIESLVATQTYGDVAADDLSRYIRRTTEGLTTCITQYDQSRQKVYFFAGANKLLVLFKDLIGSKLSPWSVYRTDLNGLFSTQAALYMREPGGTSSSNWHVYYGDDSGNIRRLDGTGSGGDGGDTTIETYRKSRLIEGFESEDGESFDPRKDLLRGRIWYRRLNQVDLLMDFEWADDYAVNRSSVTLDGDTGQQGYYFNGSAYFGGTFYFNVGFELSYRTSTKGYSAIGRGPGFYVSTTIQATNNFDVLKIEI